jgi:hypothetical protein
MKLVSNVKTMVMSLHLFPMRMIAHPTPSTESELPSLLYFGCAPLYAYFSESYHRDWHHDFLCFYALFSLTIDVLLA